eukprot:XP_011670432.1 PREDICTED: alpha-2-macroglobulin [Strongylocentrotus purpuratus]
MKYSNLQAFIVAACFMSLCAIQVGARAERERGLVITFPEKVYLNSTEKVCFTAANVSGNMQVRARLKLPGVARSYSTWMGAESDGCVDISTNFPYDGSPVPRTGELVLEWSVERTPGTLLVEKTYRYSVIVVPLKQETFIQSDKPIYQPGQKVLFRVLTVQYPELLPNTENKKDVWITSPGGTRLQQWRDQVSSDGLLDLTFELSEEPELGNWMIHVQVHGGRTTVQEFKVQEYVLPKFEVSIKTPSYLFLGDPGPFTVTICAKYTYGQPVRGRISAIIALESTYHSSARETIHVVDEEADEDTGCKDITFEADLTAQVIRGRHFDLEQNLHVFANFTERGTGVIMNATSSDTKIEQYDVKVEIRGPDVFKPLLPYHGKIVLTHPDGSPAGVQGVRVSRPNYPAQLLDTQPDGTVDFVFDTPRTSSTTSFRITAELLESLVSSMPHGDPIRMMPRQTSESKEVNAWYSPSGSFLQISDIEGTVSIDQIVPVQLEFTLPKNETQIEFFYRVISGGRIVANGSYSWTKDGQTTTQGELPAVVHSELVSQIAASTSASSRARRQIRRHFWPPHRNGHETIEPELQDYATNGTRASTVFSFDAVTEMSPKSQILVYYIRNDTEVVSASTHFKMASAFKNQVSLQFLDGREIRPGQTASIALNARPSSLCALGVVDKSVHIMGGNNQLSKAKVLNPLSGLNVVEGSHDLSCPDHSSSSFSSRHVDSAEGFRTAGVGVHTDLKLETRPCWERRSTCPPACVYFHVPRRDFDFRGGLPGPMPEVQRGVQHQMVFDSPVAMAIDINFDDLNEDVQQAAPLTELRSYFPETWLWELKRLGSDGQSVIEEAIPHTITDWVANAFCLSSEHGIGVAEASSIRAFQPFFLSYTLPYSIIRGEKVPVKVTIFNYLSACLNIQLAMTESSDFRIEARPASEDIEVCGNSAETLEYEIIPTELGDLPIRVTASAMPSTDRGDTPPDDITFPVTDALEDTILVEPEGAEREETFSELICPSGKQLVAREKLWMGCLGRTIPLGLPSEVVPGSLGKDTGDIMGPVMSNLDGLLRMPFGCGEQNMIFMAPNIYVMPVLCLHRINYKFMTSGYQRELTYQLRDHSYSAFGQSDGEGSTWLTAFVLKCFSQAQDFMDIDEDNLDMTRRWLSRNPRDENGCIVKKGRVIHREMQGSVLSPVTMTAFVTIALLEAGANPQDTHMVSSLSCIRNGIVSEGETMDTYTLAISSYALGLGEEYATQTIALNHLNSRAVGDDGQRYWSKPETSPSTVVEEDAHCHAFCRADSSAVEMTSYVLLAYMNRNAPTGDVLVQTMPMVKWLNTQRNALGGFSSTQDTVLGLQALSQFASLAYDPDIPLAVSIDVDATRAPPSGPQAVSFEVDNHNRLVLQREELEEVPTELEVTATGSGCVLFQAELMYNVPVAVPNRLLFNITTSLREWETNSITDPAACGDKILDICVRYVGSGEETGMATMEVKMVSGYVPHEQSLNRFQDGNSIGLKRFDKYKPGQPLSLYFDKFDNELRCIPINLKQEIFVKETKDAVIKVYDYYKPTLVGFKSYNTCEAEN